MRNRILSLLGMALITCLMACNSFAQGISEPKGDNNLNQQEQVKTIFSFKNEIALTDDQEVKLKAILYDEQTLLDADNNSLKTLGAELSKMIDQEADMKLIKDKLEEISKIQVEVNYRNIEDSRKFEKILSSEQFKKWRDIQAKFSSQPKS